MISFRRLIPTEFEAAYTIVREAAVWLRERDLPTWLVRHDIYRPHHMHGENYGLWMRFLVIRLSSFKVCKTFSQYAMIAA
jgi:hypothetical protein